MKDLLEAFLGITSVLMALALCAFLMSYSQALGEKQSDKYTLKERR